MGFLQLVIRILIPREVARTPQNALWHLLSGDPELVHFGMEHYQARDAELYNIVNDLRVTYAMEDWKCPTRKKITSGKSPANCSGRSAERTTRIDSRNAAERTTRID